MNLIECMRVALRGIATNKMRSGLTVLGIVIGISAVIALMSVGRGAQATIASSIRGMGSNLLLVYPGATTTSGVRSAIGSAPTLTYDDAKAIASAPDASAVAMVAPERSSFAQVVASGRNVNIRLLGVTPEYQYVRNFQVTQGEFILPRHVDTMSMVAVLGANVAQDLFGDSDPIGQRLRVNRRQFQVIGVLEKKGGTGFGSQDDQIIIPLTTLQSRLSAQRTAQGSQNVSLINIQAVDEDSMETAKNQVAAILRQRHRLAGDDDFTVTSQQDILATMNQAMGIFTLFLGSIAGISLVVGGIGIMNIMLVSITERTREIGLRKAVGARRRDILLQFLIEAAVLSLGGGGVGVLVGWLLSQIISQINLGGQRLQSLVSADIVLLALSVSAIIGLFFGIYPATRAARLSPIEALRRE